MSRKNGGIIGPANTPVGGLITGLAGGVWRMNDVANFVNNSQWPKVPENIENSCRFDDGSSDYLIRTPSSASNSDLWTLSFWVKRCTLGTSQSIYGVYADANNQETLAFDSSDKLYWQLYQSGGVVGQLTTNRLFRDTSAWYHIVIAYDSENSTAGNRMRMYVNSVEETSFATDTNPSSGQDSQWNSTTAHSIGRINTTNYIDMYLAEFVHIDGQALDPTSFGETNTATGIWTPKKIGQIANAGTNSFYLDFKDSSTLGNDASGLNNDFTVNNLTSIDQTTDTCVVNYATLNPLDFTGSVTASEGNTVFQGGRYKATFGVSSGKWYWEAKRLNAPDNAYIGIKGADGNWNNSYNDSYTVYTSNGKYYLNGSDQGSYGSSSTTNDILIFALDMDNGKFYIGENGTFYNSGDPAASSNPMASSISGTYLPVVINNSASGTDQYSFNFGNPSFTISSGNSDANGFGNFEYAVPSGYYALNTTNLNTYG